MMRLTYVSMREGFALVTDDRKPGNKASRHVKVISSGELASRL